MKNWLKRNWWIVAGALAIAGMLGAGAWYYFENYGGNSNANNSNLSTSENSVSKNVSAKEADFDWSNLPTKEVDLSQGNNTFTEAGTYILSGTMKINAGSDGIQAITNLVINGGEINIENSLEGLEATNITINGGTISIYSTDDGVNASQKSTLINEIFIRITGGNLTIKMANGDTDALDSNGNLYISGGTIDITAQFAFDFDGTASYTGGTITVNGSKVTTVTNSMMGGFQGGRR
ncbi:MAG: carbohydrate-binding domain-containing protein [bacterium]|nr:carbohydrate-binding domain-containing protein [bacterium]